ncbi:MAG: glycosyltransferase family 39 protein [Nanoarchaeota archaeon]|nr:glycosyltransferase family 39 protein [Nanoarchaeota archaeon]
MKITKKKKYYELDLNLSKAQIITLILAAMSLLINLFYFSANTGVWWDEAEYLSFVNHIVKGSGYSMWEGRAILYPLILSVFGFISTSGFFLRIILVLISCATVVLTFLVINALFKEKIAIIATLLFLTNNLFNFFSIRFLTGIPSLLFILLGVFFFLKNNTRNRLYAGLFIGVAVAMRFTSVFIIPALILHDLLSKSDIKKYVWIPAILLGFVPTGVFDLINGNLPWTTLYTFFTQSTMQREWGMNLGDWTYYLTSSPHIMGVFTVIFFIIGGIVLLSKLKSNLNKNILFISCFIILHLLSYSFLTPLKEERYMIPALPFIFSIAAAGIVSISATISKSLKKTIKTPHLKSIINGIFILIIAYGSLSSGYTMINQLGSSYSALGEAGNYLKTITANDEIIITNAGPHTAYYTERKVAGFPDNMSALYELLDSNPKINFLFFSFYETLPNYMQEFVNNTRFNVVSSYASPDNAPIVVVLKYLRE